METENVNTLEPSTALASAPLTVQAVLQRSKLISELITHFKEGVHFSKGKNGEKDILLKPGAEKILDLFQIRVTPRVEEYPIRNEQTGALQSIRVSVRAEGNTPDGALLGIGVGACSSEETKFSWREVGVDEYAQATAENRRAVTKRNKTGHPYDAQEIRPSPADAYNTVLKVAKKRAMVDLCLTATAASDCFTQDLEEREPAPPKEQPRAIQPPKRKSAKK